MVFQRIKNLLAWSNINPTKQNKVAAQIKYDNEAHQPPKPATILEVDTKTLQELLKEEI